MEMAGQVSGPNAATDAIFRALNPGQKPPRRQRSGEREQFLRDVITTAIEGGTNGWAACADIERADDLSVVSVKLYCTEGGLEPVECGNRVDDVCKGHVMTPDVLPKAFTAMRKLKVDDYDDNGTAKSVGLHKSYVKNYLGASGVNDAGEVDAYDASNLVQLAIFGEVIYG